MKWPRLSRRGDQAGRTAEAEAASRDAQQQLELSRRRQQAVRRHVVMPLQRVADHNQFAEMIEDSLREGYRRLEQ